jgi:hypothetical protein
MTIMNDGNGIDFSGYDSQQNRELITENTIVPVCMQVTRGGFGPDGWLRKSNDGLSLGLNCKFVVIDGEYKGRVIYTLYTLDGVTDGQREAKKISGNTLQAILEGARGVMHDPKKTNPEWLDAVHINDHGDFHGLCFLIKVGIAPPQGGYPAKSTIKTVITPNMPGYFKVDPVPVAAPSFDQRSGSAPAASAPSNQTAIALPSSPVSPAAERPAWAK